MRRKLFNLAAAVSMVLCVSAIVFWLLSYRELIAIRLRLVDSSYDVGFPTGQLTVARLDRGPGARLEVFRTEKPMHISSLRLQTNVTEFHSFLGFGWWNATTGDRGMFMPCWFVAALLAIGPAAWLHARWKVRRAKREGMCPSCGYDLRATPQRCPECGAVSIAVK